MYDLNLNNLPNTSYFKDRFDLREYVQAVCPGNWRRTGNAIQGHNPLDANDTKPSFTVYADGFKDFGSGDSGDAIEFVKQLHGLEYPDALHHIADYFGGTAMLRRPPSKKPILRPVEGLSETWRKAAEAAIHYAKVYLWSNAREARRALNYLRTVRGLSDETIQAADLGYNPTWRKTEYIKPDGKGAQLPPGITIPWRVNGELRAIRVRCRVGNLAEALGIRPDIGRDGKLLDKYLSFAGSKQAEALYIVGKLDAGRDTVIVEGEFDALLSAQHLGGTANVVTLGSASNRLSDTWRDRLAASPRVLLSLDADKAGISARDRLIAALAGRTTLLSLYIPNGKDVTDYVVLHGGSVAALIAEPLPIETLAQQAVALPGSFDELIARRTMAASRELFADLALAETAQSIQRSCIQVELTKSPDRDLVLHELADTWRAKLNTGRYVYPAIAPVCELILEAHKAGLLNAVNTSAREIMEAAVTLERHTSAATIRRGIAEGIKAGFFAVMDSSESSYAITANNSPGRPVQRFGMVSRPAFQTVLERQIAARLIEKAIPMECDTVAPIREHLIEMFTTAQPAAADGKYAQYAGLIEGQPEYAKRMAEARRNFEAERRDLGKMRSTPYPTAWRYRTATEYKAGFVRAILNAAPDIMGKRVLACEIGASHGAINGLLDKAGAVAIAHTTDVQMFDTDALDQVFQRDAKTGYFTPVYDNDIDGRPALLLVDGRVDRLNRDTLSEARRVVEEGGDVIVRYQNKSTFEIVSETQPAPVQRQPRGEQSEKIKPEKLTQKNPLSVQPKRKLRPVPFWGETYSPEYEAANLVKLDRLIARKLAFSDYPTLSCP